MADEIVSQIEFKELPGWPAIRVSKCGRVQTCRPRSGHGPLTEWRDLTPSRGRHGYLYVNLKSEKRRRFAPLHRIILEAWVGLPPEPSYHACHNDGNNRHNHIDNLRWDNAKGNNDDKHKHGTWQEGDMAANRKLNSSQVIAIRELLIEGVAPVQLASRYGVTKESIINILKARTWTCV